MRTGCGARGRAGLTTTETSVVSRDDFAQATAKFVVSCKKSSNYCGKVMKTSIQAPPEQERLDDGVASPELTVGVQRVLRPPDSQHEVPETIAILPGESAVLLE